MQVPFTCGEGNEFLDSVPKKTNAMPHLPKSVLRLTSIADMKAGVLFQMNVRFCPEGEEVAHPDLHIPKKIILDSSFIVDD